MINIKKSLFSIFLILFYILGSYLLSFLLSYFFTGNILLLISTITMMIFLFFLFRNDLIADFGKFTFKMLKDSFKYYFIGYVLMVVTNNVLYSIFNSISSNEIINREILGEIPVTALFIMVLIGPFCEEVVFRLNIRKISDNKWLYVFVSGLLFGLLHVIGSNIIYAIPYALLGGSIAYMYVKTNNIWTSIFYHMFHNLITITFIIIAGGTL